MKTPRDGRTTYGGAYSELLEALPSHPARSLSKIKVKRQLVSRLSVPGSPDPRYSERIEV